MNTVVIGGGLAGLTAAHALRSKYPEASISVLERNESLGGLLCGKLYPEDGHYFDLGTHIFQETGNPELDSMLLSAVSSEDLIHFPIGKGDLAGSMFAGRLQSNTHFPDLRDGVVDKQVIHSLRSHIEEGGTLPPIRRTNTLVSTAVDRFGLKFTDEVIGPILSQVYKQPLANLSGFAMLLPGWTRVVIDNMESWKKGIQDERYRSIVAVPEQRKLPPALRHTRRSFYSRQLGSRAFINGLTANLGSQGIRFVCGAHIQSLQLTPGRIELIDADGLENVLNPDLIIIATGAVGAAQLLGVNLNEIQFENPMPHWVINIVLEEPCNSDLCYLYGLDSCCEWYRVTNYRALTGRADDRRLTIEVLGQRNVDRSTLPRKITTQLKALGFLESSDVLFSDVIRLKAGFPSPTVRNMQAISALGLKLNAALPREVIFGGIGAGGTLFFQNEIIADLHKRVSDLD
jgi:oxygen-dependent protoporphyrinogen oxidase